MMTRLVRGTGELSRGRTDGDDFPFFLYGGNGVRYVFSMGDDDSQGGDDSQSEYLSSH